MKKTRRIAWVLHGSYKNEGRVYKESQTLAQAGYKVRIFATCKDSLPLTQQEGSVSVERLVFPVLSRLRRILYKVRPTRLFYYAMMVMSYTLRLTFRIWRYKADIIHCQNVYTLHIGFMCGKLLGVPYVYDSHDLFIEQAHMNGKSAAIKKMCGWYERFFARRAAVVFQTSRMRSEYFEKMYGVKASVIMNKAMVPKVMKTVLSTEKYLCLRTSKSKLVYVGGIMPGRGIETLIEAVTGLDSVQIFLLGNPAGVEGHNLLEKYKKQVCWIPAVPPGDVTNALKVFDLGISLIENCCLSYYFECPTKVWELIISGTPQIASDFPEIRKVVVDNGIGPVGRVVDPSDARQVRRSIEEMINNPAELEMCRKNCLRLRESCRWRTEADKLVDVYSRL